jgi:hypothetical protein
MSIIGNKRQFAAEFDAHFPASVAREVEKGPFTVSNEVQARLSNSSLPVVSGREYRLDVNVQGDLPPNLSHGRGRIVIHFYNANNQKLSHEHLVWHSDDWTTFAHDFTPPANAATMKLILGVFAYPPKMVQSSILYSSRLI